MFDNDSPHNDDDRAVSPVIGVILMVAITVILAAVIGTFVLNLGGSVQTNVQAGVSVNCNAGDPGSVDVTWTSNQNADTIDVTRQGSSAAFSSDTTTTLSAVGQSASFTEDAGTTSDAQTAKVISTAKKGDQSTVISTKECEI